MTEVTRALITSHTYGYLSGTFGAIGIVLLMALLAEKEFARASASARLKTWLRALNIAILPLLLMFVCVVTVRFLVFLFPGLR